jgi:predicted chitinase
MFVLTPEVLQKIMPRISSSTAQVFAPEFTKGMSRWCVDTWDEITMFLANIAHESGELQFMEEIWGPTYQQLKYERDFSKLWSPGLSTGAPNSLAYALGNDERGDGRKFSGHGPIQVTGKTNHVLMGFILEQDFVTNPKLLTTPHWGVQAACVFWWNNFLDNKVKTSFVNVVKAINGGLTGLPERQEYLKRAQLYVTKF